MQTSLLDRIAAACDAPRQWQVLNPVRDIDTDRRIRLVEFSIRIDDGEIMKGYLQVGKTASLRFGLLLPLAPGREHLIDLLTLPPAPTPPDPHAWLQGLPDLLAPTLREDTPRRISLARDLINLHLLRRGYTDRPWRLLGHRLRLGSGPTDTHPFQGMGGQIPAPTLGRFLDGLLMQGETSGTGEQRAWSPVEHTLGGDTGRLSGHERLALQSRVLEDAHALLGAQTAQDLLHPRARKISR